MFSICSPRSRYLHLSETYDLKVYRLLFMVAVFSGETDCGNFTEQLQFSGV